MEEMQETLNGFRNGAEITRYGVARLSELAIKMADLESVIDVTLVKKKRLSMTELFGKWQNFQETIASKNEMILVANAGPVW